ncbi:MAG: hypothetical protein ACK5QE_10605 [Sphingobacteriia bacterium]|jgi:hypothetical protein
MYAETLLTLVHRAALAVALGVGPLLLLLGLLYKRRFRTVLHQWRHPQLVILTILAFLLGFSCFVLGCFFLASSVGRMGGSPVLQALVGQQYGLAMDCFLLFIGISLSYAGVQFFFTQFITRQGIVLRARLFSGRADELLRWADIRDYYVKTDYPLTHYHFLSQDAGGRVQNRVVKVPYYARPKFEYLLQGYLAQQEDMRASRRAMLNRFSKN